MKNITITAAMALALSFTVHAQEENTVPALTQHVSDTCLEAVAEADAEYMQYNLKVQGIHFDIINTRLAMYLHCMRTGLETIAKNHMDEHRGEVL